MEHRSSTTRAAAVATIAATLVATLAVACSDQKDAPAVRSGGRATVTAASWSAALIDSATRASAHGDSAGARVMLARATVLAASAPSLVYNVAVAQDRAGNVGAAARGYRNYLALAPGGARSEQARARLDAIVSGPGSRTHVEAGEVGSALATNLSDPAVGVPAAASAAPTATAKATRKATRAASRPGASKRVARSREAQRRPKTIPRSRLARANRAPRTDSDSARAAAFALVGGTSTRDSTAPVESGLPARTIHYSRWSRMQRWVVARAAGLGGAGGAVVGALIGNVPGAIALGTAGGAATGLARVHRDKVDSAKAIKAAVAARARHDGATGGVGPPR
jgi:hypothetical protein